MGFGTAGGEQRLVLTDVGIGEMARAMHLTRSVHRSWTVAASSGTHKDSHERQRHADVRGVIEVGEILRNAESEYVPVV